MYAEAWHDVVYEQKWQGARILSDLKDDRHENRRAEKVYLTRSRVLCGTLSRREPTAPSFNTR